MSRTANLCRPSIACWKACNKKGSRFGCLSRSKSFLAYCLPGLGFWRFLLPNSVQCPAQTISFRPFSGSTLTTLRAGLALKTMASPVNGFTPLRDLVAGLRTTLIFIKPGNVYIPGPVRLMSRLIRVLRDSNTALTSLLVRPVLSVI